MTFGFEDEDGYHEEVIETWGTAFGDLPKYANGKEIIYCHYYVRSLHKHDGSRL